MNWNFEKVRRVAISIFVVANLCTVLFVNKPPSWGDGLVSYASRNLSSSNVHRLQTSSYYIRHYAYIVGADNRWQMFGGQSRFNWRYNVSATYSDGTVTKSVDLPLPRQSPRTLAQLLFYDFREAKFHLNIYGDKIARESYARYLGREYSTSDGLPIQSITYHMYHQMILTPDQAMEQQKLMDPRRYCNVIDTFDVRRNVNPAVADASSVALSVTTDSNHRE